MTKEEFEQREKIQAFFLQSLKKERFKDIEKKEKNRKSNNLKSLENILLQL